MHLKKFVVIEHKHNQIRTLYALNGDIRNVSTCGQGRRRLPGLIRVWFCFSGHSDHLLVSKCTSNARILRGEGGGRGSGTTPMKNHKNVGFSLAIEDRIP